MSEKVFSIGNVNVTKGTLTKYGTIDYFTSDEELGTICVCRQFLQTICIPLTELKRKDIIINDNNH